MSVNTLPQRKPRRWAALWPLLLSALLLLTGGALLWQQWPRILLQSVLWQKSLHQQMIALLQQVALHPHHAGLALLGFSLIYGILHAAGPGHGKVVIATFLVTHSTRVKTSLHLTFAAALVQGSVAILLVSVVLGLLKLSSRQLHLSSYWLEKSSYLLVVGLGVYLCWRAGHKLWRRGRQAAQPPKIVRLYPENHQHDAHCGCGHLHVPNEKMLATAVGWKTKLTVILSMGLRPCSGAIMMLLFAKVIGVYAWGVLSALAMAVGTALTVSAMALLVQTSRTVAIKLSRYAAPSDWQKVTLQSLGLAGGVILIVGGVLLWQSAQPAMSGGIRGIL